MPSVTNGTTAVWRTWVVTDGNSTSASFSSGDAVWGNWNITTASTSNTATVWLCWNEGQSIVIDDRNTNVYQYKPAPETEEQKQLRLQQEEERKQKEVERIRLEAEAKKRAEDLLISQLNPVQLQQFKEMDAFLVELQTKRYRVRRNSRVQELDKDGKQIAQYCIHPNEFLPAADVMLAQKLMLESDEAAFLKTANRTIM